jgi:hypothetical protein
VYGQYFANVVANLQLIDINSVTQIRRGVDGTGTPATQPLGAKVVDSSIQQKIPFSSVNNIVTTANATVTVSDPTAVSYGLRLTQSISANIGDIITQVDSITSLITATMRVLQTITNGTTIPVLLLSGAILDSYEEFDGPTNFDEAGFSEVASYAYVNGVNSNGIISGFYILGDVNASGQITVLSGTKIQTGNIWYSLGATTITSGAGLVYSTTPQAIFLKQSLD